ncbi:patatin [Flavobacteriaceae bacterium R38]|nr:patatin [Flavobacteriaceae bacterium R38]
MHEFGIVLSGGGVKGAAHVGVIKALEEHNLKPTCIAGTSAGALAGAFYASGHSADEIMEIITSKNFFKLKAFTWSKAGLLDAEILMGEFKKYFRGKSFESLEIELHVATTDIVKGTLQIFNSGSLMKPLMASCAFPFIFAPVKINNSLYSDGGIINNFPVETIIEKSKNVLGVYVSPLRKITEEKLNSSIDVADRAYRISNRYESLNKLDLCTWSINPMELENYGTFTISKIREIYEIGYLHGKDIALKIKNDLM